MKRIFASIGTLAVTAALVLGGASSALAEDTPPDETVASDVTTPELPIEEVLDELTIDSPSTFNYVETDVDFELLDWLAPGGLPPHHFDVDQTLVTHQWQEDPNLDGLDAFLAERESQLACGVVEVHQLDLEIADQTTADLIEGAVLHEANDPPEHHAYGYVDGDPWKFVTLTGPECVTNTQCDTFTDGGTASNPNPNGWVDSDTRSKGHAVYVENGLHIYSDPAAGESPDQRKVQWQKDVADFPLSQVGQFSVDYDSTSGAEPGVKLVVEFSPGVYGTLIWEEVYDANPGDQDLWLPESANALIIAPDNGGGFGSTRHGTVDEWLSSYPGATVLFIQFGNGSGVDFDGVLHSFNVGCATYSFDFIPAPESTSGTDVTETVDCETGLYTRTETPWTQGWVIVDGEYVPGEKVYGETVVTTRDATVDELDEEECPLPEQPDPRVVEHSTETQNCKAELVSISTWTETFGTHLVDRVWVEDETPVVSDPVASTRAKTDAERILCNILAYTPGGEHAAEGVTLVAILILLGTALIIAGTKRKAEIV